MINKGYRPACSTTICILLFVFLAALAAYHGRSTSLLHDQQRMQIGMQHYCLYTSVCIPSQRERRPNHRREWATYLMYFFYSCPAQQGGKEEPETKSSSGSKSGGGDGQESEKQKDTPTQPAGPGKKFNPKRGGRPDCEFVRPCLHAVSPFDCPI